MGTTPAAATNRVMTREWRHLARHRADRVLVLVLWLPLLLGVLVWAVFAEGTPRALPIVVVDQDNTPQSRTLTRLVDAPPGVSIAERTTSPRAAERHVERREAYAVMLLPEGFSRDVSRGRQATLVLRYNAQLANHAAQITRDVRTAVATYAGAAEMTAHQRRGADQHQAAGLVQPIAVEAVPLYNEALDYEQFLGATLIPAVLQILVMITAVSAIGRELRDGTAGHWLRLANNRVGIALLGKLMPYALIHLGWGLLFLITFGAVRGMTIDGSLPAVLLGLCGLILASGAIGILIVAATRNMRMALSVAGFLTAPAFAYAGQGFPLHAMPPFAQGWATLMPLTHWLHIQNQNWFAGAPATVSLTALAVLGAMVIIPAVAGTALLRRRAFSADAWGAR